MIAKYIGIGAAVALALMFAIWQVQVARLRAEHSFLLGQEQAATRAVQASFDSYKLQVEQGATDQATNRANENLAALERERALQAEADRFRSQAATATRQRNEASQALLKALNDAPQTDVSPLDSGSRDFYKRLHELQTARAGRDPPAPR